MGFFRFRRSFKLLPGVHINLSKTGPSLSIGRAGATVNLRSDRVRETVGIPGTGLSYREEQRVESAAAPASMQVSEQPRSGVPWVFLIVLAVLVAFALLVALAR